MGQKTSMPYSRIIEVIDSFKNKGLTPDSDVFNKNFTDDEFVKAVAMNIYRDY